jgi:hypothetical protein
MERAKYQISLDQPYFVNRTVFCWVDCCQCVN